VFSSSINTCPLSTASLPPPCRPTCASAPRQDLVGPRSPSPVHAPAFYPSQARPLLSITARSTALSGGRASASVPAIEDPCSSLPVNVHPIEVRGPGCAREAVPEVVPEAAPAAACVIDAPLVGVNASPGGAEWQERCLCPASRLLPSPLAASSPAVHTGFIRAIPDSADNVTPTEYQEVSILVDSGSQQARSGNQWAVVSDVFQVGGFVTV